MGILFLIVALPFCGFLFSILLGNKLPEKITGFISSISILCSFVLSLQIFTKISANPAAIKEHVYTFLSVGDFKIDFALQADRLSSLMLLVITGIGFLIHLYSIAYMHGDKGFYKFFAYLNLFVFNMLVLVLGANFVMLFFGWEGVGLCSYLLIGFWYSNVSYGKAARKAFIMNRIGDLGLLLALFLIQINFKSFDYDTVFSQLIPGKSSTTLITTICILLFVGAMGKSAQIPLYTWLPDAMAGPTPVSALIHAATMVTAGVYLVIRCNTMFSMSHIATELILFVGLATSILAAIIGLKQNDIKKVLAYSTVSQLGLMFVALGVGSYAAAMFHLITHAFFKALLFLGSGSIIHAMSGEQDIRNMGGLKKSLPITHITFLLGTLAICGFPFFSGFFSKDEILADLFKHNPILWFLGVGSALLTCVYMLRMYWVTFYGDFRGTTEQKNHLHESPILITLPLILLAILSVIGGVINLPPIISKNGAHGLLTWLNPVIHQAAHVEADLSHTSELLLVLAAVSTFIIAFVYTRLKYISKKIVPEADEQMNQSGAFIANKFKVDELYDAVFVNGTETASTALTNSEENLVNGSANGLGKIANSISNIIGKIQNGNIEYYLLYMLIGIIIILLGNLIALF